MDISEINENLTDTLNEITMERYLSVAPNMEGEKQIGFIITLFEGDKKVPNNSDGEDCLTITLLTRKLYALYTAEDIISIAKKHFDNITDDIRVVWN